MRDIDHVIAGVRRTRPDVLVEQLQVTHPADDDGIWCFKLPSSSAEVQLESSSGNCPFLVESDFNDDRQDAATVSEAIAMVTTLLQRGSNAAGQRVGDRRLQLAAPRIRRGKRER
jgi:hypothetical protein